MRGLIGSTGEWADWFIGYLVLGICFYFPFSVFSFFCYSERNGTIPLRRESGVQSKNPSMFKRSLTIKPEGIPRQARDDKKENGLLVIGY